MYTVQTIVKMIKRKIMQLASYSGNPTQEIERGNILSNDFIIDAINSARKIVSMVVKNTYCTKTFTFSTIKDIQEYNLPTDIAKILGVMYDDTEYSSNNGWGYTCSHVAGSTSITTSGLTSSYWNGGTIMGIINNILYYDYIVSNTTTTITILNGNSFPAFTNILCILVRFSYGAVTGPLIQMGEIKSAKEEIMVLKDSYHDLTVNPKYRLLNNKIRLILSKDGTVPLGKRIKIEYIKNLPDLTITSNSDMPEWIDEMVVDWASFILTLPVFPSIAMTCRNDFFSKVRTIKAKESLNDILT